MNSSCGCYTPPSLQFAAATAQQDPRTSSPGSATSYCSMGFALLQSCRRYHRRPNRCRSCCNSSLFTPLGMQNSWLGLPREPMPLTLLGQCLPRQLPPGQWPETDWHWNSLYWRTLGAPWGGTDVLCQPTSANRSGCIARRRPASPAESSSSPPPSHRRRQPRRAGDPLHGRTARPRSRTLDHGDVGLASELARSSRLLQRSFLPAIGRRTPGGHGRTRCGWTSHSRRWCSRS
ncbi:MAG UNVERIFIED_CONTAM: hypothetical protein LVR18_36705 [Planctomycetaceae bacterium]|jgi:hypothetical protein